MKSRYVRSLTSKRTRKFRRHGFDVSPAMIVHAHGFQSGAPTLAADDIENVPLSGGSMDVVPMTWLVDIRDDPFAASAEVQRMLRPGGLWLLDDGAPTSLA